MNPFKTGAKDAPNADAEAKAEVDAKPEEEAPEFPRKGGSGSGTSRGYTVEARLNYNGQSKIINGMALGPKWVQLSFNEVPGGLGVPKGLVFGADRFSNLLGYPNAQALRWWFVATAAEDFSGICLETRLVEHELKYSHTTTGMGAVEAFASNGRPLEDKVAALIGD